MAEVKLDIGNPKNKKTYKLELKGSDAEKFIGKKIGDKFSGILIGASGYELEITGGSDKSGFPMLPGIAGGARKKPILSGGRGFHPKRKGQRRRKTVVGNTISDSTSQINCKIIKSGKENIDKVLVTAPAKGETKADETSEEKPVEKKKEESPKEKVKPVGETPKKETLAKENKSEESKQ